MLLYRTLTRPLADRVSREFRARRRNSPRQSQGDTAGIDSFRPENGRCTTSTSISMIASSCAMHPPYPWREEEGRGISRRMEVVVISFGLWPMFDVTCRPRAVPTRHGMFGSRTPTCFSSFGLYFVASLCTHCDMYFWGHVRMKRIRNGLFWCSRK